jgi:hypothetical protein
MGNPTPAREDDLFDQLYEYQEESTIEFYELATGGY